MSKTSDEKKIAILKEKIINVSLLIEKCNKVTDKNQELEKERSKYFKWLKKIYESSQTANEKCERLENLLEEYKQKYAIANKSINERELEKLQLQQLIEVYKVERTEYGVEKIDRLQKKLDRVVCLYIKAVKSGSQKTERFPPWFLEEFGGTIKKLKSLSPKAEKPNYFATPSPAWSQQCSVMSADSGFSGSVASNFSPSSQLTSPPLDFVEMSTADYKGECLDKELDCKTSASKGETSNEDVAPDFICGENGYEIVYTFPAPEAKATSVANNSDNPLIGCQNSKQQEGFSCYGFSSDEGDLSDLEDDTVNAANNLSESKKSSKPANCENPSINGLQSVGEDPNLHDAGACVNNLLQDKQGIKEKSQETVENTVQNYVNACGAVFADIGAKGNESDISVPETIAKSLFEIDDVNCNKKADGDTNDTIANAQPEDCFDSDDIGERPHVEDDVEVQSVDDNVVLTLLSAANIMGNHIKASNGMDQKLEADAQNSTDSTKSLVKDSDDKCESGELAVKPHDEGEVFASEGKRNVHLNVVDSNEELLTKTEIIAISNDKPNRHKELEQSIKSDIAGNTPVQIELPTGMDSFKERRKKDCREKITEKERYQPEEDMNSVQSDDCGYIFKAFNNIKVLSPVPPSPESRLREQQQKTARQCLSLSGATKSPLKGGIGHRNPPIRSLNDASFKFQAPKSIFSGSPLPLIRNALKKETNSSLQPRAIALGNENNQQSKFEVASMFSPPNESLENKTSSLAPSVNEPKNSPIKSHIQEGIAPLVFENEQEFSIQEARSEACGVISGTNSAALPTTASEGKNAQAELVPAIADCKEASKLTIELPTLQKLVQFFSAKRKVKKRSLRKAKWIVQDLTSSHREKKKSKKKRKSIRKGLKEKKQNMKPEQTNACAEPLENKKEKSYFHVCAEKRMLNTGKKLMETMTYSRIVSRADYLVSDSLTAACEATSLSAVSMKEPLSTLTPAGPVPVINIETEHDTAKRRKSLRTSLKTSVVEPLSDASTTSVLANVKLLAKSGHASCSKSEVFEGLKCDLQSNDKYPTKGVSSLSGLVTNHQVKDTKKLKGVKMSSPSSTSYRELEDARQEPYEAPCPTQPHESEDESSLNESKEGLRKSLRLRHIPPCIDQSVCVAVIDHFESGHVKTAPTNDSKLILTRSSQKRASLSLLSNDSGAVFKTQKNNVSSAPTISLDQHVSFESSAPAFSPCQGSASETPTSNSPDMCRTLRSTRRGSFTPPQCQRTTSVPIKKELKQSEEIDGWTSSILMPKKSLRSSRTLSYDIDDSITLKMLGGCKQQVAFASDSCLSKEQEYSRLLSNDTISCDLKDNLMKSLRLTRQSQSARTEDKEVSEVATSNIIEELTRKSLRKRSSFSPQKSESGCKPPNKKPSSTLPFIASPSLDVSTEAPQPCKEVIPTLTQDSAAVLQSSSSPVERRPLRSTRRSASHQIPIPYIKQEPSDIPEQSPKPGNSYSVDLEAGASDSKYILRKSALIVPENLTSEGASEATCKPALPIIDHLVTNGTPKQDSDQVLVAARSALRMSCRKLRNSDTGSVLQAGEEISIKSSLSERRKPKAVVLKSEPNPEIPADVSDEFQCLSNDQSARSILDGDTLEYRSVCKRLDPPNDENSDVWSLSDRSESPAIDDDRDVRSQKSIARKISFDDLFGETDGTSVSSMQDGNVSDASERELVIALPTNEKEPQSSPRVTLQAQRLEALNVDRNIKTRSSLHSSSKDRFDSATGNAATVTKKGKPSTNKSDELAVSNGRKINFDDLFGETDGTSVSSMQDGNLSDASECELVIALSTNEKEPQSSPRVTRQAQRLEALNVDKNAKTRSPLHSSSKDRFDSATGNAATVTMREKPSTNKSDGLLNDVKEWSKTKVKDTNVAPILEASHVKSVWDSFKKMKKSAAPSQPNSSVMQRQNVSLLRETEKLTQEATVLPSLESPTKSLAPLAHPIINSSPTLRARSIRQTVPLQEPAIKRTFSSALPMSQPLNLYKPSPKKKKIEGSLIDDILDAMEKQAEEITHNIPTETVDVNVVPDGKAKKARKSKKSKKLKRREQKEKEPLPTWETLPAVNYNNKQSQTARQVLETFLITRNETAEAAAARMKECISGLESISNFNIVKAIVGLIIENVEEELDLTFTPPAPPLTPTQHRLFALFSSAKMFERLSDLLLPEIRKKILPEVFFWPDDSVESCARFYAAACRHMKNRKAAVQLCIDALTDMEQRGHIVVYAILNTWSELLPKAELVTPHGLYSTLAFLVLQIPPKPRKAQETKRMCLRNLVSAFLGYKCEETKESFAAEVLEGFLSEKPGFDKALIAIAKRFQWKWAGDKIVSVLMNNLILWKDDITAVRILRILEEILTAFPQKDEKAKIFVKHIVEQLGSLLHSKKVSHLGEEKIVLAILPLGKYTAVDTILHPWMQTHKPSSEFSVAYETHMKQCSQPKNRRRRTKAKKKKP